MTGGVVGPAGGQGLLDRVAGAPISWGVCEVPGWGRELPREQVLAEMRELGLAATELGPDGYLPDDSAELRALLDRYQLRALAGFLPAVLHVPEESWAVSAATEHVARRLAAAGAELLVVAAASGAEGYESRPELDDGAWETIEATLGLMTTVAEREGLALVVHPHVGTVIEGPAEIDRLLEETDADLCVDTGHLVVGGADPLEVVRRAADRVRHVHLKDVDGALAEGVRSGRIGYVDAVRRGLFRPLGRGDAPIVPAIAALEEAGYSHWYVLEQDVALPVVSADTSASDLDGAVCPARDVAVSLDFLRMIDRQPSGLQPSKGRGQ